MLKALKARTLGKTTEQPYQPKQIKRTGESDMQLTKQLLTKLTK